MALDRNGKSVAAGDVGTWEKRPDQAFKVASVMEAGSNSRIEIHLEGKAGERLQILAKEFQVLDPDPTEVDPDPTEVEPAPAA